MLPFALARACGDEGYYPSSLTPHVGGPPIYGGNPSVLLPHRVILSR